MSSKTLRLLDILAPIFALDGANGCFQRHVAYDLRRDFPDLLSVKDLARVVNAARERYNRIHDGQMTDADLEWVIEYSKWEES